MAFNSRPELALDWVWCVGMRVTSLVLSADRMGLDWRIGGY